MPRGGQTFAVTVRNWAGIALAVVGFGLFLYRIAAFFRAGNHSRLSAAEPGHSPVGRSSFGREVVTGVPMDPASGDDPRAGVRPPSAEPPVLPRAVGGTVRSRVGTGLVVVGLGVGLYCLSPYLGLDPGGQTSVPEPVALSGTGQRAARLNEGTAQLPSESIAASTDGTVETNAPVADSTQLASSPTIPLAAVPDDLPAPSVAMEPPARLVAPMLQAADADDRRAAAVSARPGVAVRLRLPTIQVDTEVKVGGPVPGNNGQLEWETLPFVATTYPVLGPVGGTGNPVISGHVVTLREGNVFRELYRLDLGDPVDVDTETSHFTYRVEEVKLVDPSNIEVMAPSEDARLTLITCGGTFDPLTRSFSERLIVVGKLVGGERVGM
jgi:LPXTG-site transpeptidase (sortase) family protein